MIKAVLMNPDVYCWAYFPSCRVCCTDSAGRMLRYYLPAAPSCFVCVCVCFCCKGVGCEMIDNSWHKSWHLCVDRWPSGCTGWRRGYGTAVQGALLGSTACQCDVFPYGCLILSVFYWTRVSRAHRKTHSVLFEKCDWTQPVGPLSLSHSLSFSQMLLSQALHTVSNFCTLEGLSPVCRVDRSWSCVAFQTPSSPGGFCSSLVGSINRL